MVIEIKTVTKILKKRFNNLTAEELVDLAFEIIEALEIDRKKEQKTLEERANA